MPQQLSTELHLDALLSSGFKDAFGDASDLMSDLKKESAALRKQLSTLGKEADSLDKIGAESEHLRRDFRLLERQIRETERATEKFADAKRHFRAASVGVRALRSDLAGIIRTGRNAALAIAGIGTAAAFALSPDEELLTFDQTLAGIGQISPEIDTSDLELARSHIRELSNEYGVSAAEIAQQHLQLTRNLGFEGAQETIRAAVAFETATGLGITEIEEELATARISLGIDTPSETRQFLELLQQAHQQGIKIDNIDLGDLETLVQRTGEDVFGQNFQREFLTTIAFRQVDSFQFADYAQAFQEDLSRSVVITPAMEIKEIAQVQENLKIIERHSIRAEDGILGAMRTFQDLSAEQQTVFRQELAPILGEMTVEVIARGSEALPRITEQVDNILASERSLQDAALGVAETWSGVWSRIGVTGGNALAILREQFAQVFGPGILALATRFFDFINSHQAQIQNFFTGIRDGISPVISRIWASIRDAYPDIRAFAFEIFSELKRQWQAIAPVAGFIVDQIWGIAKAVGGFLKEHPRLVATVISGVVAWKAYKLAAGGVGVVGDVIRGATSLAQGHIHRLNAIILENARLQGTLQSASLSIGKVFSGIGKAALGAIPGIGAMGGSLFAAIVPALPALLPILGALAALGAAAYVIHKNWQPIKSFFVDNFETIRSGLMFVFPPLGLLIGFAQLIRENWEPIKSFFSALWEMVKLSFQTAFELIQFVALSGVVAIKNAWASITGFFAGVWQGVTGIFTHAPLAPIFNWMVEGVKVVVRPLIDFFDNFWENLSRKAGEVLGWITDKFQFMNNLLDKAFGWFKKENEELRAELNLTEEDLSGVSLTVPDVQVALSRTPPDGMPADMPVEIPQAQIPDVPDLPELESIIQAEDAEKPIHTVPITPSTEVQTMSISTKEMVNVGRDILTEIRKQTLLMERDTPTEVGGDGTSTVPNWGGRRLPPSMVSIPSIEMPSVEIPTAEASGLLPEPVTEIPSIEVPEIAIESPIIDTPQVEFDAPSVEVVDAMMISDSAEQDAQSLDMSAEQGTTTAPVTVNNSITVVQQPGEDAEALAQRVVELIDQSSDTFLVQ